ncbi:MAG: glycoside hydrolase family 2 TIM barrel-domain containing protein [Chitinophagaceae bacterium]
MNKGLLFLLTCWAATHAHAQSRPDWENPEVFAINKENTRATSLPYPTEALAARNDYASSPYFKSLNGNWQFYWVGKIADVPSHFYEENYKADSLSTHKKGMPNQIEGRSGWTTIPVPGNWEFNGFGIPMYVNTGFGFSAKPPFIDRDFSPTGTYRHPFDIPQNWDGRKVFLHFEGGTNSMYVWVNGKKVGYTENAKSPAEFDITPYIRTGNNLLACEVHKFSDGSYMEDQDMWRLGGINRSVYLYSTAQTRIQDFFAHADLDANYKNGLFSTDVKIQNYSNAPAPETVEVSVLDKAGKKVFSQTKKINATPSTIDSLWFEGTVKTPLQWTAETPNLYNMLITLKNDKGNLVEATSHRIGFRKVEIKDGQVFINGKKVLFKGVNLHEFNTNTGQVVDSTVMLRNIQLFKELNINAVRTSHYPQQSLWYKLCDQYGIYLVDEDNLESHGLGYGPDNVSNFPEWQAAHLDRMKRLIERDKNHASVIFWSLGNEASNGKAFYTMYDWAKARDKSRPVQYEQAYQRDRNTDIICHMYPSWESMQRDAKKDLGRPYIMCEYAHAMGNSMGNFQEYWDLIRTSKNMQGGFIWEWYNHGYKTKDEQGREYWAYGGDLFGYNRLNEGNFCIDGIISPDQQYLPHTHIVKKVYQNILFEAKDLNNGVLTVKNDFKFISITPKDYTFKWVLLKNGVSSDSGNFNVAIPADSKTDVKLNLPNIDTEAGTEYYLQVFANTKEATHFLPAGFESAKGEFALNGNNYFSQAKADGNAVEKKEDGDKLTLSANGISYEFYKNERGLAGIKSSAGWLFGRLPKINFWRAPTDNDYGSGEQNNLRIWDAASHAQKTTFKGLDEKDGTVALNYEIKPLGIDAIVNVAYTVNKDGSLTITPHYTAQSDELPEMMRFGMNMEVSDQYNNFTWYGRGPWENYVDRKEDAFMGIWKGDVKDQAFAYYRPQEAGNKTDVRWLTLTDKDGKGIRITGAQPLSMSATNHRTEDWDAGTTKKQQHPSDILPADRVILNVDLFQRGVGGLNSWGAKPLDQYRFKAKDYQYSYTIQVLQ